MNHINIVVVTVITLLSTFLSVAENIEDDDGAAVDNNTTNIEVLPEAVAWTDAPMCPLWGPMDSFYREGIEKGRVSV